MLFLEVRDDVGIVPYDECKLLEEWTAIGAYYNSGRNNSSYKKVAFGN